MKEFWQIARILIIWRFQFHSHLMHVFRITYLDCFRSLHSLRRIVSLVLNRFLLFPNSSSHVATFTKTCHAIIDAEIHKLWESTKVRDAAEWVDSVDELTTPKGNVFMIYCHLSDIHTGRHTAPCWPQSRTAPRHVVRQLAFSLPIQECELELVKQSQVQTSIFTSGIATCDDEFDESELQNIHCLL